MQWNTTQLNGNGFDGKKSEIVLDNYTVYTSRVRTEVPVELEISNANNWLQFHYQLSGKTNTILLGKNKDISISPNSLNILYQKKGNCLVQFPVNCIYKSFGFRVDPQYFSNSFLCDFTELSTINEAITMDIEFRRDKKYAEIDVKTRDIISSILHNPYSNSLEKAFIEHKIIELIFHSIPFLRNNTLKIKRKSEKVKEKIILAEKYIRQNLDRKLSLAEVAKHCSLNLYTLKVKFKEYYNQSTIDYYIDLKLKRAYDSIQNSNLKITAIAYEAGYASVGNFSNAFFNKYGFRPSKLRENN